MFSIVIPHYNGLPLLKNCLKSISESIGPNAKGQMLKTEIIVVDNGSTDGSKEYLEKMTNGKWLMAKKKNKENQTSIINHQSLKVIFNDRNLGFAAAVNQGIKAAEYDWVVVMNNDLKVDKNWFLEIQKVINNNLDNTSIAALFGKVLNWKGTKIESTGLEFYLKGKAFNRGNGLPAETNKYNSPEFIFGPSASIAAYYKPALEQVGLFDEDFFAYEEDVDLALRLYAAGWKTYYIPSAVSYHIGGETSGKMGNFRQRMDAKNWWFIIIKNYPLSIIFKHWPEIFIERLRNLSGLIKKTTWYKIPTAVLSTYAELISKLPKIIKKRKPIGGEKLYEISKNKN
jgi:GT2 family glycosyltransferase